MRTVALPENTQLIQQGQGACETRIELGRQRHEMYDSSDAKREQAGRQGEESNIRRSREYT